MIRGLIILLILIFATNAFAHARLKASAQVAPRSANAGVKTAPCGGYARVTPVVLQVGQTITVTWEETIQHPGRYEFSFSTANDQNFQLLTTVIDTQDGTNDLPHQYSVQITLPSTPCTSCTLQMIQVMTENPAAPTYYYSCADIVLQTTPAPTPTPGLTPAPTPTPTPAPAAACPH